MLNWWLTVIANGNWSSTHPNVLQFCMRSSRKTRHGNWNQWRTHHAKNGFQFPWYDHRQVSHIRVLKQYRKQSPNTVNIIKMLGGTKTGEQPTILTKSLWSLNQSVAKYTCTVGGNSNHEEKMTGKCSKPCDLTQAHLWTPQVRSCQRPQRSNTKSLAFSIVQQSWE